MKLVHDNITPHLKKLESAFSKPIVIQVPNHPFVQRTKWTRPISTAPMGGTAGLTKMRREIIANRHAMAAFRAKGLEIVRAEIERRLRNIR